MEYIKIPKQTATAAFVKVTVNASSNGIASAGSYATLIQIFSGTPPTANQLNSIVIPGTSTSTSDSLVAKTNGTLLWSSYYHSAVTGPASGEANGVRLPDSAFANASRSGIATWFMIAATTYQSSSIPTGTGFTISNMLIGTISTPDGDGDLRLTDTNMVAGQSYRIGTIHLSLPYESGF